MAKHTGWQNPKESYANKCQKHIAFSYGYKLVYVDDYHLHLQELGKFNLKINIITNELEKYTRLLLIIS